MDIRIDPDDIRVPYGPTRRYEYYAPCHGCSETVRVEHSVLDCLKRITDRLNALEEKDCKP